jgi:hypothetical protein
MTDDLDTTFGKIPASGADVPQGSNGDFTRRLSARYSRPR